MIARIFALLPLICSASACVTLNSSPPAGTICEIHSKIGEFEGESVVIEGIVTTDWRDHFAIRSDQCPEKALPILASDGPVAGYHPLVSRLIELKSTPDVGVPVRIVGVIVVGSTPQSSGIRPNSFYILED